MKAAYLTGKDLAVHSIDQMLSDRYGRNNVTALDASSLAEADLSRFDMLLMPGCVDEVSPYPTIMTPAAIGNLKNAVERGLFLWTDCAASYDAMRDIEFLSSTREIRRRNGLGFYDGVAKGPIDGHAIAPSPEDRFVDVVIRRIFYNCANDDNHSADICYGNGPGLHLSEQERNNPNTTIIARYGDHDTAPAAAISKKIGQGMVLSLGVLVQIAPNHLHGNPADENLARHRTAMFNHLSGAETQRQHFLNTLFSIVDNHKLSRHTPHALEGQHYDVSIA